MSRPAAPGSWAEYWDSDVLFRPMMERSARRFVVESERILGYRPEDTVLDFGCGPGYVASLLAGRVREVHGVDTSPRMIAECRARMSGVGNAHFHLLEGPDPLDLDFLGHRRFTVIVCLSVVQYLGALASVERLLRSFGRVATAGALLLVADIPVDSAPLRDALELLRASWREGMLAQAASFLLRSAVSPYARVRASRGLLVVSAQELRQLAARVSLPARILDDPLTFNRRRVHLLAEYGGR